MSGLKISKADLFDLARALGADGIDKGDPIRSIYLRLLARARELGEPPSLLGPQPPAVIAWARLVLADTDQYVAQNVKGDEEVKSGVYRHWVSMYVERAAEGIPRGLKPVPPAPPRDSEAQARAVGAMLGRFVETGRVPRCSHGDHEVDPKQPGVCGWCLKPMPPPPDESEELTPVDNAGALRAALAEDRRKNAEEWAKTRGSKGRRPNA